MSGSDAIAYRASKSSGRSGLSSSNFPLRVGCRSNGIPDPRLRKRTCMSADWLAATGAKHGLQALKRIAAGATQASRRCGARHEDEPKCEQLRLLEIPLVGERDGRNDQLHEPGEALDEPLARA